MNVWIALFRGINVGGHNRLWMQHLVGDLLGLGFEDVRTVIQSGNVVFRATENWKAARVERAIQAAVHSAHGFRPEVLVLDAAGLRMRMEANPFPEAEGSPRTLHLFFAAEPPTAPDLNAIGRALDPTERFRLLGDVFYLHAPKGIGRSRLASGVERWLGVPTTARNWNTLEKLRQLAPV